MNTTSFLLPYFINIGDTCNENGAEASSGNNDAIMFCNSGRSSFAFDSFSFHL
jgi:hypothetical protein